MNKRVKSNSIRIIAGQWRGRRLPVVDSQGLRPTIDRVRETLFNWLMNECSGAQVLDLFAGTGVLGLECLSRGAQYVDFVEKDKTTARLIENNLQTLNATHRAQVWALSADTFLARQKGELSRAYDLVFLDPPFSDDLLKQTVKMIEEANVLANGAYLYVEMASDQMLEELPSFWRLYRQGKAGQSRYYLYQRD